MRMARWRTWSGAVLLLLGATSMWYLWGSADARLRAVFNEDDDVSLRTMLKAGMEVDRTLWCGDGLKSGWRPLLSHAARSDAARCAAVLLESGAPARNPTWALDPVRICVAHDSAKAFETLIAKGCVRLRDDYLTDQNTLEYMEQCTVISAVAHAQRWNFLGRSGVSLSTSEWAEFAAEVPWATGTDRHRHEALVRMMSEGKSPNMRTTGGTLILQEAVDAGDIGAVAILLAWGAEVAEIREGASGMQSDAGSATKAAKLLIDNAKRVGDGPEDRRHLGGG